MIRATHVKPQHRWTEEPADTVVLDFDDRHRRRMAMTGTRGEHLWLSHQLYRAGVLDWAGAKHTIQWSDDVWRIGRGLLKKKRRL